MYSRATAGSIATVLASSPLFNSLDGAALRSLESELTSLRLRGGETLCVMGEPGDSLYVVLYGRLRALVPGPNGAHVLGEVGRGESVGEMAVLTGAPRSATVCAVRDTELVQLSKVGFERLMAKHPQVMLEFTRLIINRYQQTLRSPHKSELTTLAVVPCSGELPISDFTDSLGEALSAGRRVLRLDRQQVSSLHGLPDDLVSADGPDRGLGEWLSEQELQHDYLIYQADPAPSTWTRLCLRQADVVLVVGAGDGHRRMDPRLLELLQPGEGMVSPRTELVLLYDSRRDEPSGTAEWLARVAVEAHHHLDPRLQQDFARLSRMLTGQAVGLVLGGGGARGLAHIGVIRAIEEAGIPIDLIVGTSIGSIVGAQYACGWDTERMVAESRRAFLQSGRLHDYTLPLISLLRGRRYMRLLQSLFGDRQIEDLPRSYFCITTNLTQGNYVVHRSGPLWRWVLASIAVPGLGPPVWDGQDLLVDGGVLNILPVDVLRSFGRGPVFASNVSPRVELRLDREYPLSPSPWRVLLSWLSPYGAPMGVPSIVSVLMRVVSLPQLATDAQVRTSVDLLFEPPVARYRMLDWSAVDQLVDIGYRSAVATLEEWQQRTGGVA
jgi:NTE family protein